MSENNSTTIISWDVGIIHLAYCVLKNTYSKGKHDTEILDWDEINLLEDDRINLTCSGLKKAKKGEEPEICGNCAGYYLTSNNKYIGFCKTHLPQSSEYYSEDNVNKLFRDAKPGYNCDYEMKTGKKCDKKAKYHYNKSEYYCTAHGKTLLNKKIMDLKPKPIKNTIVKKYPTAQLQLNLVNKLDTLIERFRLLGVQGVIIENQPSQKNPKMKSIANTLFDYFMIRCQVDKVHNLDFIKFINPSNKLKVNENNTLQEFKANKDESKKYKLTKELGKRYTKQLLQNDPISLQVLDLYKKQDDLCDAYLQGCHFLQFRYCVKNKPKTKKAIEL